MRVARYMGGGEVAIVEEPMPTCPDGGLVVQTEASGLCSGELMDWYMDGKIPHVLGHEVSGLVIESQDERFPVGSHVFPHHHAPCMKCEFCKSGRTVHCEQWKRTKLVPGGMADYFGVPAANLTDTHRTDDLRPQDAALVEPLACVCKSIRLAQMPENSTAAVIGLGSMGLLHMLLLPEDTIGYDLATPRIEWARQQGLKADEPFNSKSSRFVFVCPGSQAAFDSALRLVEPGGTIVMFAPLPPGEFLKIPQAAYFLDLNVVHSYSCGPEDTAQALVHIRAGQVKAEQICSDFIGLDELPKFYRLMKSAQIQKPMVLWPTHASIPI